MSRTIEAAIEWAGGDVRCRIKIWSFKERDDWARRNHLSGDGFVDQLIEVLGSGSSGIVGAQLAKSLADEKRQRKEAAGRSSDLDMLSIVLESVTMSDGTAIKPTKEWLENLDGDLFDMLLAAAFAALTITEEDKKKSQPGPPEVRS